MAKQLKVKQDEVKQDEVKQNEVKEERKIRVIQPVFGEKINSVFDSSYKYYGEYIKLIKNKATRMHSPFAVFEE